MADAASGPLHAALATVRQTNAAHVSALDALERSFSAQTALILWLCLSIPLRVKLKRPEKYALWL